MWSRAVRIDVAIDITMVASVQRVTPRCLDEPRVDLRIGRAPIALLSGVDIDEDTLVQPFVVGERTRRRGQGADEKNRGGRDSGWWQAREKHSQRIHLTIS
jgi:hypothetical protein